MIPFTKCKGCVFAEKGEFAQVSCELDRASKLGVQETDEDGCFVLSRFCSAYRPQEWVDRLTEEESVDLKSTVMKEVRPKVGFFILLETKTANEIEKFKQTLEDIINQEDIKPRYVVVVNDKVEYNQEIFKLLASSFDFEETEYHMIQLRHKLKNKDSKIDEAFMHAKNGWVYVTTSGEKIPRDLLKKIHKRVNIDMKKLVVVKPYDDTNGLLFQSSLFKFVNGNRSKLYQDEIIDTRSFMEKVESAAEKSGEETLITWSQFNES